MSPAASPEHDPDGHRIFTGQQEMPSKNDPALAACHRDDMNPDQVSVEPRRDKTPGESKYMRVDGQLVVG